MGNIPAQVLELIEKFDAQSDLYRSPTYNETQVRIDFINPMFKALGWDIDNTKGYAKAFREVVHEDAVMIAGTTKSPDYSFRIGGQRYFFLEAKKPSINIHTDVEPAYQLRRYGWTAGLPLSILTNFAEFAVYECHIEPKYLERASTARSLYLTYKEYPQRWDEIASIFSPDGIQRGSYHRFVKSRKKSGTQTFDDAFLGEMEEWRKKLAGNIALRNPSLDESGLNFATQRIIDRIVFLRMCEDRGVEPPFQLQGLLSGEKVYARLQALFVKADQRYNSGLFHFHKEKDRHETPDELTPGLELDDTALKHIIKRLYYPDSPYVFKEVAADILGNVYERFLGNVIRLTAGHHAKIEPKPEVRKAGGVYYTPKYIVDYIVHHTVGALLGGTLPPSRYESDDSVPSPRLSPADTAKLRILDPACGSGSFLLGAYQYLLDWHQRWYLSNDVDKWSRGRNPTLHPAPDGQFVLSIRERKHILKDNIYGVDLDPQAVEVTKLSLLLKCLEGESQESIDHLRLFHERTLPDLGDNIKCGNSLISTDMYDTDQWSKLCPEQQSHLRPFNWQDEYSKVMQSGGFDAVIGNPPYGADTGETESAYLREHYESPANSLNTFLLFVERTGILLKRFGLLGLIIPSGWASASSAEPLRRLFLRMFCPTTFVSLPFDVFKGAYIDTIVLTAEKGAGDTNDPERSVQLVVFPHRYKISGQADFAQFEKSAKYSRWLQSNRLEFLITASDHEADLVAKVRSQLSTVDDTILVKRGIETYNPASSPARLKNPMPAHTGTLQRYDLSHGSPGFISYPREIQESKPIEYFSGERILLRQVLSRKLRLQGTLVADCFLTNQSVQSLIRKPDADSKLSLRYVLGILNSKLISWYFRQVSSVARRDDFPKIIIQQTRELPLRPIKFSSKKDNTSHDRLVSLVDQMLSLHKSLAAAQAPADKESLQRQIDATDRQIDRLVYDLYGLTEDEIKIVEQATQ